LYRGQKGFKNPRILVFQVELKDLKFVRRKEVGCTEQFKADKV